MKLLSVALVVAAVAAACAFQYPNPDNIVSCGVPPQQLPPMPPLLDNSSLALHQVSLLFRHGDRTIAGQSPCWPNDSAVWNCSLTDTSIPNESRTSSTSGVDRLYRKVYMQGRNYFPGNCMTGQLTDRGYQQELHNGEMYFNYLVNQLGFLPTTFTPKLLFARADDDQRVIQSLESFLLGMYPPSSSGSQKILNIHTMDKNNDTMTINTNICPKWQEYYDEMLQSPDYVQHLNEITYPLLAKLESYVGVKYQVSDIDHIFDCLTAHACHQFDVPFPYDLYEAVKAEANYQEFASYTYPNRTANAQVGIGFLLQEVVDWMKLSVAGADFPKFVAIACHDTTLMPIMAALDVYQDAWVPYASRVSFEVYKSKSSKESGGDMFYVRALFLDQVLMIDGADRDGLVPWSHFVSLTDQLVPQDPAKTCYS